MRILLVSQMYPGRGATDLGVFVRRIEQRLATRGHEIERAVITRRGAGVRGNLQLMAHAITHARRFRPQVIYAHFLVPAGLFAAVAARASGARLVVTAHGQDVANLTERWWAPALTRWVIHAADEVVVVSEYLREQLQHAFPELAQEIHVINCGIDLTEFPLAEKPEGPIAYLAVGSLIERKNVLALADAFEAVRRDGETLTFVGDGPLRPQLEGRRGIRVLGAVPPERVQRHIAEAHVVCLASKVEPLGQALLEAMASGRTVVGTKIGGPPEFVPPTAGILVDPHAPREIAAGLSTAAAMPCPNEEARRAAAAHEIESQVDRIDALLQGVVTRVGG